MTGSGPLNSSSGDFDQSHQTDGSRVTAGAATLKEPTQPRGGHSVGTVTRAPVVSVGNSGSFSEGTASAIPCAQSSSDTSGLPTERPGKPFAESATNGRKADGTFTGGNLAALRHGARSEQVKAAALPEQTGMRAALAARRLEIEADLGGSVSRLSSDMVGRYIELSVVADYLGGRLVAEGPLTTKGRQRAALTAYLSVVDRLHRVATALGLERRQKPVNPLEAIHRAAAAAIGRHVEVTE